MSENKFIRHLQGKDTAKSVLEIRNQNTPTSFANMPDGSTSNANDVYSDHRGNATGVLKGSENWKLDGQDLVETTTVYGDGRDLTSDYEASGNGLWVDATVAFATARRFNANTKFVLKLCGHDLETVINHTVDFTLIVKFGTSILISKTFTVTEQAFDFCKEFVIDFAESNSSTIKADTGSTMQVQLLCADANARATIYDGMTVFTALQRRVDGDAVASDKKTFDEVVDDVEQLQEDVDDLEEYVDDTLQQQINHLQTIGRFLSFWDATTGLAQTNPQTSPYVYQTGDYFRVGVVAGPGGTNYKPSGSSYTIGVASTTVETERLSVGQVYYYDGANWALAAGGSVAIDETTITFNNNDEIQAVAVIDQNTGIVKTWTGTAAEYDAIVTKDPDTEYIITDDVGGSAILAKEVSERNIGELVYSLVPITDSGLHLLDGDLLDGTGIYADFYDYMADIQATAPQIFCSEADWQTSISTYGVCGKFVIDTVNHTIRLPKVTGFVEGTVTPSALGDLVAAGLPNITGKTTIYSGFNSGGQPEGSFYVDSVRGTGGMSDGSDPKQWIGFDASRSSSIYGNSTTVQPQSIKGYIYMVIANTAKTPVQVDIDNIATDLNNKVNKGHEVIEFQAPTAANNYTWYRLYADGWVEQGGYVSGNGSYSKKTVILPIPMADVYYHTSCTIRWGNESAWYSSSNAAGCSGVTDIAGPVADITTTSFSIQSFSPHSWEVKGMAAV